LKKHPSGQGGLRKRGQAYRFKDAKAGDLPEGVCC